jgi:hypothetical protein
MKPIPVRYLLGLQEHYEALEPALLSLMERQADVVKMMADVYFRSRDLARAFSAPHTASDTIAVQIYLAWLCRHLRRVCHINIPRYHEERVWDTILNDSRFTNHARVYDDYLLRSLYWIAAAHLGHPEENISIQLDPHFNFTLAFLNEPANLHHRI